VIFAVLAATALTWAKCWPYASKTAHVLTNAFGGVSILTEGGRTPRPRHRGTRHGPSPSPTSAPSGSHWSPRSSSLSQLRRSYRGAGWYASAPLARRIGRWRPARAAINNVHLLHAPLTVTLRRRGVPPASALAYRLGKPRMIRIFHALLLVAWALPLSTCAGAISEGRLTLARGTES